MGKQKREDMTASNAKFVPGPGMYETRSKLGGAKYGFGSSKRGENSKENVPGPGQYHIPCKFGDVPRYQTVGGRFEEAYRFI